ncbi:MAG: hypothetical protein QW575_05150 [Thermoproteota archaeon]
MLFIRDGKVYKPSPDVKSIKLNYPTKIYASIGVNGYYIPSVDKPLPRVLGKTLFKNKGYRNIAYLFATHIGDADQTLVNINGVNVGVNRFWGIQYACVDRPSRVPVAIGLGVDDAPHNVSRYELYNRYSPRHAKGSLFLEYATDHTAFKSYHRYAIKDNVSVAEVGFYYWVNSEFFLLARTILSSPINRLNYTVYEDGYEIDFPFNYNRNFIEWIYEHLTGLWYQDGNLYGSMLKDIYGNNFICQRNNPYYGSPDVMIGSDNTTPSLDDYNLLSPISSLLSQSYGVEIDTYIQECRVVRQGTYTPSTSIELGEIGLFWNVYDVTGVSHKTMFARGVWSPKVTLTAGTSYTIGIVLKFG